MSDRVCENSKGSRLAFILSMFTKLKSSSTSFDLEITLIFSVGGISKQPVSSKEIEVLPVSSLILDVIFSKSVPVITSSVCCGTPSASK